ncbi:hypothetical protein EPA93_23635 [Ktedonosporobacter rubrisoli]|uniref:HTH cro/C1-type domain-containing protein n=1 Tax=Ktedonosporobacter rubrisoli TaxID=2509675 RepID=A0A4P6JU13_KTERU|nr:substrate-binding domain-containing protein [Ktedonosporobacter rubrisoli]QBD78813.1 hypothetical protein EPA93_23635 [Ktedonosporobacter rubrisoli]
MPVKWTLKKWLAVEHNIYRPSQLQVVLAQKAGVQLSLQAISSLLNSTPSAIRLQTIQALCNALHCSLSDFCEVVPDDATEERARRVAEEPVQYREQTATLSPTVSHGIEQKLEIEPEVREIIMRILREQGLIPREPPAFTSSASVAERKMIGMLIPSWLWSVTPDLTRGAVECLAQTNYDLVLYSLDWGELESGRREVIDNLLTTQLTVGLLAAFPGQASHHLTHLHNDGFPVVIIDDQNEQATLWVGADNTAGAYMAVRHLIQLGHRRIAHIKGPSAYLVSRERYLGYCQALLEAGIAPDLSLVLDGDFSPQGGKTCAHTLLELPAEKRPTAIFASSDQMAYGVLSAAEAQGLRVPQDIAVVGFDDDPPSIHMRPALTTVAQPYFELGQQGMRLLLSVIEGKGAGESEPISPARMLLHTRLVVRETCGAAYKNKLSLSSDAPAV